MFHNLYFEELINDLEYLDQLTVCRESQRIFAPFLQNNFADLFSVDPYGFTEGIYDYDIVRLCNKAKIFPPVYVPCIISRNHHVEEFHNKVIVDRINYDFKARVPGKKYCIGVGHYVTRDEGPFHMCVIIDLYDHMISSLSFSDEFAPSITEKAIATVHDFSRPYEILIHSSQNKIYQSEIYREICDIYGVLMSMTSPGSHGGVAPVSHFFSNLKRKMGDYVFTDIQDGIDWLSCYVLKYNTEKYIR